MERVDGFERARVEFIYNERMSSKGSSTLLSEIADANSGVSRRGKERIRRMEHLDDECSSYSREIPYRMDYDLNLNRPEYANFRGEEVRDPIQPLKLRPPTEQWDMQGRFNHVPYHDEGPPRYNMDSCYEQGDRTRYPNHDLDGPPTFRNLENNRAELLRRLDELKDQISQSCDVTDKPIKTGNHAAYVQEGLINSHVGKQSLGPDDMASPYLRQAPGFVSYTDRCSPSLRDSYPQKGDPHEYADKYQQEMYWRSACHLRSQYMHLPYHEHFHGNINHDLFGLGPDGNFFDQPACSCVHCINENRYLPPKVDRLSLHNRRSQNELPPYHQLYPIQRDPHGYNSGSFNLHTSHSRQSIALSSTKIESGSDGSNYNHPKKVVVAHRNGQVLHPIAGGAPIIACSNCFELLKLPRRRMSLAKSQHKLKCGACSSIVLFELGNRGSTVPGSGHVNHISIDINDASILTEGEDVRYQHDGSDSNDMNTSSNDYDDSEPKVSPDKKSISSESEKQLNCLSSALSLSEDKQTPEILASGKHGYPSAEVQVKEVESFPHPRLSSEECLDHCSANILVNGFDKGKKSIRSDFDQNTTWQNSVEDSTVATERDMSLNEFSNSGVSEDSVDKGIREEHHPMVNKGAESLFAGFIKKSFGNFKKPTEIVEVGKSKVFVNGHLIPDHLVEKAEELAGPIQPGEYWYDIRAGFWGVIGHPCLGLVMPNIEEFNYPMPNNCGAGNTGVFVNGRELHQRDLGLLTSRGLPNTGHGSYLVDISGKVVDEETGEELHNLGRLAPTVEKAKHGFGMKVPRFIARLQS